MSEIIMVTGASGAVGSACVEALLAQGAQVLATGRSLTRLAERLGHLPRARLRLAALDLTDPASWPEIAQRCRRIIQCAGPSYRLTGPLLTGLLSRGGTTGIYVDAGGDGETISRWHRPLAEAGWQGIFGAGVQPGLVGVAIRALCAAFPHTTGLRAETFTGGHQPLTLAGLEEYLQAVHRRTGYPGMSFRNGVWERVNRLPPLPDCFPATAQCHPYTDEEAACAAEDLALFELRGFTVSGAAAITRLLNEAMVTGGYPAALYPRPTAAAAMHAEYFFLHATVRESLAPGQQAHSLLSCTDSYRLTGAVAAWAALNSGPRQPGAGWFSRLPGVAALWQQWRTDPPPGVNISWHAPPGQTRCEEGTL
ncbi:SDR family NAD(P)-dependent oxidoreductase [Shimwellia pseudoproteus]|uniref:NAD-dependent epimerase/dehydratase family protein n=1 Tax=Shimwellia pseudoproteus TaxID=570012 RepID=UPI0018EA8A1A|nr:SDR family NAD(P)-dependent oxidoreductase [Shimwellia pseudoproteus]MBJ3813664.1 SDR family NAD(P)-dependent oxidoreductase [Shimwellia pseudoproteus]